MRHAALTLAFALPALLSAGCEPLPEEDVGAAPVDPTAFLDRSSDPEWGPDGRLAPTVSDAYENSAAGLSQGTGGKNLIPSEIRQLLERASEVSKLVSQVKTATALANTWLHLFDYIEKEPTLSDKIDALHRAINDVADLTVDMHRKDLHHDIEEVFIIALRRASEAFRTETEMTSDWGSEAAILKAARPTSFERMYRNNDVRWYHTLIPQDELANGKVWDWRLGMPALLLHTSLRTVVMAAQDRNFGRNPAFASELKDLGQAIHRNFLKMGGGIRCDWRWATAGNIKDAGGPVHVLTSEPANASLKPLLIACLDIHSGIAIQERALGWEDARTLAGIDRVKYQISQEIAKNMPVQEVVAMLGYLEALRK